MIMKKSPKSITWISSNRLVQIVEELREELMELGAIKGLQDPEVIQLSKKLDEYINGFYRKRKRTAYGSKLKIKGTCGVVRSQLRRGFRPSDSYRVNNYKEI